MSAPIKTLKKGEVIFKEGDKITQLSILQKGAAQLVLQRQKKNIEMFIVNAGTILGEGALSGLSVYPYTAIATQETQVVDVPVESVKNVIETAPQMTKMLIKSLSDRLKTSTSEVKSSRLEKDPAPCPDESVARVFGALFHVGNHKGVRDIKDANRVVVDWQSMRQYAQRVFGESPKRLEQAVNVLVKLKLASLEMGRPPEDPEGPEQLMKVHLFDLLAVESFFEYFQYYYYKNGRSELLKADDLSTIILTQFVTLGEKATPDRHNIVTLDFAMTMERFKTDIGMELKPDHFSRLEMKGIFPKRQARTDGTVVLQFDIKEFQTIQKTWRILREIDKWNEKGFVDINEAEEKPKKKAEGPCCPQCEASIVAQAKFCSECGYKMVA